MWERVREYAQCLESVVLLSRTAVEKLRDFDTAVLSSTVTAALYASAVQTGRLHNTQSRSVYSLTEVSVSRRGRVVRHSIGRLKFVDVKPTRADFR